MINKESFIVIMDSLRDYWDKIEVLVDELEVSLDNNVFVKTFDRIMEALGDDLEDEIDEELGPTLYYYAFECDFGRNEEAKDGLPVSENLFMPLTSAAELYDYLFERHYRKNIEEFQKHYGFDFNWE